MRKLLALLLVFGLAALTVSGSSAQSNLPDLAQYAPATGQPKVLKENMKTVTATVESIDLATRAVTLKNPDGKVMGLKVGEEVKNLPQVKVGDKVAVTYYESIAARIIKPVTGPASGAQQAVATAKPGEKPAGAMVPAGDGGRYDRSNRQGHSICHPQGAGGENNRGEGE